MSKLMTWLSEITYGLHRTLKILILGGLYVVLMWQDQTAETLRILADPSAPFPVPKITYWVLTCAVLMLVVYGTARVFLRLPERREQGANEDEAAEAKSGTKPNHDNVIALMVASFIAIGTIRGFIKAIDFSQPRESLLELKPLEWGLVIFVALTTIIFCILAFSDFARTADRKVGVVPANVSPDRPQAWDLTGILVVSALIAFFIAFVANIFLLWLPAPYVVVLFFGSLFAALAFLEQLRHLSGVPFVLALLSWALLLAAGDWTDNHSVRLIDNGTGCDSPLAARAFDDWLASRPDRSEYDRYPVFIIAAEGGGLRAAYMTFQTLRALQEDNPAFADHLFAVVGVSGGSVGAAMYTASRRAVNQEGARLVEEDGLTALRADLLSPTLTGALGPDLLARFLPAALGITDRLDRARWIEDALDRAWVSAGQESLASVGFNQVWTPNEAHGPALILLSTQVETGQRLAISHLLFNDGNGPETLCEVGPELDVPLLTAAFVSARFPYITPAATIPAADRNFRVVDGGYFENSGVTTVMDLLRELEPARREADFYVVRVENSEATTATPNLVPGNNQVSSFGEIMSPLRALMGTRAARGELAVRELERRMGDQQQVIKLMKGVVPIPLGWWLSEAAWREIDRQIELPENKDAFTMVAEALTR